MTLPKTALFIDGANFYATCRDLGWAVDFVKLREYFDQRTHLLRAYYYTTLPESREVPLRRMIDFLDYNGYSIATKDVRVFYDEETGEKRVKGNMDIEIALDMLQLAPHLEQVILFSGDSDFARVVLEVQRLGVNVVVVSSLSESTLAMSDDLRRQADSFIDLTELEEHVRREHKFADNDYYDEQ